MSAPQLPRIALIGLGGFGRLHAETLAGLGLATLVAVVDRDSERIRDFVRLHPEVAGFTRSSELFSSGLLDAVIIATRSDSHVPLAKEALQAGCAVLVEKPAGRDDAELAELEACALRAGRVVMVNHLCLFHSLVNPLVQRLRDRRPRALHFIRHRPVSVGEAFPEESPLTLLTVHDFYVVARIMEGREPVEFKLTQTRNSRGKVDCTWILLRWGDDTVATFHAHCLLPPGAPRDGFDAIEVFGEGYHTRIQTNAAPWVWDESKREWPVALEMSVVEGRPTGMLAEAQRAFLSALGTTVVPVGCRLSDARQIQRWTTRLLEQGEGR